jgi:hypothetical protein
MLKRLAVTAKVICGIVLAAGAMVLVAYGDHQASVKYQRDCQEQVASMATTSGHKDAGAKDCQDPKDYMPWWHILIAWPEGITVWAILFTLGAIVWQSSETRNSVQAALSQGKAQMDANRGWVLIESIRNPGLPLFSAGSGYAPGIVYCIKVFGNTPATITRERYRCCIVPAIPGTSPRQPQLEKVPQYSAELNRFSGSVSPPGYSYAQSVPLESGPLTEESYRELQDGKTLLCSYCSIEYTDAFRREAITQTCHIYDFALGGVFQSPDGTILNPVGFRPGGPREYHRTT